MNEEIYKPRVSPCLCPGGLWVRLCAGDQLLAEHSLDHNPLQVAELDATLTLAALRRGEDVYLYVYDGDSGICKSTIFTRSDQSPDSHRFSQFHAP